MDVISVKSFEDMILGFRGPKIMSFITRTQIRKNVYKLAMINGIVNFNYKQCLSRIYGCDMVVGVRAWGNRDRGLVLYKGNKYLTIWVRKVLGYRYEDIDGNVLKGIEERVCKDRGLRVRDYSISSIRGIVWKHRQYEIDHEQEIHSSALL